jgi:acetylornithine/N-succinyldiaminopimelate aminotransferase
MYGGHAVISIGHLHDHWQNALKDQLDKIAFYSNSIIIRLQDELALKLGENIRQRRLQFVSLQLRSRSQ